MLENTGKNIKARRKELGISAEELAKAVGKDAATMYRYESGAIEKMPVSVLVGVAKLLRTTPECLIGWAKGSGSDDKSRNTATLGERIKEQRKALGLTVDELAAKAGVARSNFYKWEKGDVEKVPAQVIPMLATSLHTTVEYLLGLTDCPDVTNKAEGVDWSKVEMAINIYTSICTSLSAEELEMFNAFIR